MSSLSSWPWSPQLSGLPYLDEGGSPTGHCYCWHCCSHWKSRNGHRRQRVLRGAPSGWSRSGNPRSCPWCSLCSPLSMIGVLRDESKSTGWGSGGSEGAAACDSGMLTSTGGGRAPENNSTGPGRWGKDWVGPAPGSSPSSATSDLAQLSPSQEILLDLWVSICKLHLTLPPSFPEEFLSIAYVFLPRSCSFLFVVSSFPTGA